MNARRKKNRPRAIKSRWLKLRSKMKSLQPLSKRQREILRRCANGETDKAMATKLGVSVETIAFHFREIFWRLKARSRCHAVKIFYSTKSPI
jgi:DNA-binding NarL/FixJ family response regulator